MRICGPCGWLAMILLAALALRVAAATVWQERLGDKMFAFPDSWSYWRLGKAVADGDSYSFSDSRAFRTPGYPLALAPLFWIYGDHPPVLAARVLGAGLGTLVLGGIAWLARKLFNDRTMLIAALLGAVYLEAIAMSVLVLNEALFCPLMIAQFILWTIAWRRRGRGAWPAALGAGICAGLAVLTRPSWLLFTPAVIAVSYFWPRVGTRERTVVLKLSAILLVGLALAMSPWWIRNYLVFGTFVATSTETGPSLYDGLHDGATGASDMRFVDEVESRFSEEHPGLWRDRAVYEVALDRYFAAEAIGWAVARPWRTLQLAGIKFVRMWNIWPNESSLRSWPIRLAVAAGYVPLLILGLVGAWQFGRRDVPYALCVLPAVYFSLLHMIFVGSIRYRQPAMLALTVLAAGALERLLQRKLWEATPKTVGGDSVDDHSENQLKN